MAFSFEGVIVFNTCKVAGEAQATTATFSACKSLKRMSGLLKFFKTVNLTLGGDRAWVLEIVAAEYMKIWYYITAALMESEGAVREAACHDPCSFHLDATSDAPRSSAWDSSDYP